MKVRHILLLALIVLAIAAPALVAHLVEVTMSALRAGILDAVR
jgi:hypothetical protein